MNVQPNTIYEFGPYRIDAAERTLFKDHVPVSLTPKAFDTLLVLVSNGGHLVRKQELLDTVWAETFIEEKTLAQNIFTLRRILGTDDTGRQYIETVPKHGYRFVPSVKAVPRSDFQVIGTRREETEILIEEEFHTSDTGLESHHNGVAEPAPHEIELDRTTEKPSETETPHRNWRAFAAAAAVVVILAVVGTVLWLRGRPAPLAMQNARIQRITNSGNAGVIGVSPDGRYVAYSVTKGAEQSIVVQQTDSSNTVEVAPPSPIRMVGITFAPDGNSLYYVARPVGDVVASLYRVPLLGGAARKIHEDVDSPVTFSPDGKQIAFVRNMLENGERRLLLADSRGGSERILATTNGDTIFGMGGPSWSPDGQWIACPVTLRTNDLTSGGVRVVNASTGEIKPIGKKSWTWIGQVAWMAGGKELLITAWDMESPVMSDQVWILPFPSGEERRLTNDVNGYNGVGVSADSSTIIAGQSQRVGALWVAPGADPMSGAPLSSAFIDRFGERFDLSWTRDGRLLYSSAMVGPPEIWIMNPDGSGKRQLTSGGDVKVAPLMTADGHYIIYLSSKGGERHVWRMNANGGDERQLTNTRGDDSPSLSPDGKWVFYSAIADNRTAIWRVSIDGGESTRVTDFPVKAPRVSPDGTLIAGFLPDEKTGMMSLGTVSAADGTLVRKFPLQISFEASRPKWLPDGSAITIALLEHGVGNLWRQPIDGRPAEKMTDWKSERIFRFDWSSDGRLAVERGSEISDLILVRDAAKR